MGTFHRLTYHVVFGTRFRRPSIRPVFRERLYEYIGGIIRAQNGHLIQIGGVEDHIHLLVNLSPTKAVSDVLRDIKANSAKWVNEEHLSTEKFEWQKGYGAFTVSYSNIDTVQAYIRNQQEHHRGRSFRDEYIEFLKRHGIEFEEQFLFEGETRGESAVTASRLVRIRRSQAIGLRQRLHATSASPMIRWKAVEGNQ